MQWIADIFISILEGLNSLTGSFGLSLVLFAALIKVLLWPLTNMQYRSMKAMQEIQPEIERLQKEYKDDREGLAKAQAEFFQEKGVNPLAGCFPLLVQMPILISIWQAIIGAPELFSNAYFLWIRPGPLQLAYPQFFASSLADRDLLLVLVYGMTMVIQQQLTPTTGKGPQKQIGLFMSVFFTGLMWFYEWPCALILYWTVFNFLNIIQQGIIHRTTLAPTKAATETAASPA